MEHWAEIRRLHRSEDMGIKEIARRLGVARNTVRSALASAEPPKYSRVASGSLLDVYEPAIRALLAVTPRMPATVVAERIGYEHSASILRARVAQLRPLYAPADPADRTVYLAGEIVQCDLWFPEKVVPVGPGPLVAPPVLTMVAAWSGFIMAVMIPSRRAGDLLAGMWRLIAGTLGAVPSMLVWDNESGIGQHHKLTLEARGFAGTLGVRIYQTRPRDPEAKGVVERTNGFLETSFMPGRTFTGPSDFNDQLGAWLPRANSRLLRRTGAAPAERIGADVAAMTVLPPLAPAVGTRTRVRLARDYYVRVGGNDYSVDPAAIGRFVDVIADLDTVTITCAGTPVGAHARCWDTHTTLSDPAHVARAAQLRTAFRARSSAPAGTTGPAGTAGSLVAVRPLSHYDELFDLPAAQHPAGLPAEPRTVPTLVVVR